MNQTKIDILKDPKYIKLIKELYIDKYIGLNELCRKLTELTGVKMTVGNVFYFIKNEMGFSRSIQEACFLRRKVTDDCLIELKSHGFNNPQIANLINMSRVGVWGRMRAIAQRGGK